ncbi:MAG: excinuclease ABC subunit C, partial [Bacteroidales bacterium]
GDPHPLFLDKNSSSLRLLMQIRDEAHRFGIGHHRGRRSKDQVASELSQINGIGAATENKLLINFKSVARIKKVGFDELSKVAGKRVAGAIIDYYSNEIKK